MPLVGTGVVWLSSDCEARSQSSTLTPFREIKIEVEIQLIDTGVLDLAAALTKSLSKIASLNISDMMRELHNSPSSAARVANNIHQDNVTFQTLIDRARSPSERRHVTRRVEHIEEGLKWAGIAVPILAILGLCWKFSLFSKISGLVKCCKFARSTARRVPTARPTRRVRVAENVFNDQEDKLELPPPLPIESKRPRSKVFMLPAPPKLVQPEPVSTRDMFELVPVKTDRARSQIASWHQEAARQYQ